MTGVQGAACIDTRAGPLNLRAGLVALGLGASERRHSHGTVRRRSRRKNTSDANWIASPLVQTAMPKRFQAESPCVARIAPTTTGTQATRASLFALAATRAWDVSGNRVTLPLVPARPPEARQYRPRRRPAKPSQEGQSQRYR